MAYQSSGEYVTPPPPQQPPHHGAPQQHAAPPGYNTLTILRVLAWASLAVGIIAGLTVCGASMPEMGEWNRNGSSIGTWMLVRNLATGTFFAVAGAAIWSALTALGMLVENALYGRNRG